MSFDNNQVTKAIAFQSLHRRAGLFVLPNAWDAGSAKILTRQGFEAIATTSAGLAFSLGKPDGEAKLTNAETFDNIRAIVGATHLPVAADLENGFGDDPAVCAQTILDAAGAGLVGGSIEDATGHAAEPIYPFELSVARIRAAVAAARSLPFPFMLAARSENLIYGKMDLPDTIRRLQAYAAAGADVLFAPGLRNAAEVAAVVKALPGKPVNVVTGFSGTGISLAELSALGVKRVSLGSSLARIAYDALQQAGAVLQTNQLPPMDGVISYAAMNALMKK